MQKKIKFEKVKKYKYQEHKIEEEINTRTQQVDFLKQYKNDYDKKRNKELRKMSTKKQQNQY